MKTKLRLITDSHGQHCGLLNQSLGDNFRVQSEVKAVAPLKYIIDRIVTREVDHEEHVMLSDTNDLTENTKKP